MDLGQLLIGGGFGAILVALVQALFNRRKLGADTAAVLSETALELVQPLRSEIKTLRAEIVELRARVQETTQDLDACKASNRVKDALISELTRNP